LLLFHSALFLFDLAGPIFTSAGAQELATYHAEGLDPKVCGANGQQFEAV
jgi:hypothetical protein